MFVLQFAQTYNCRLHMVAYISSNLFKQKECTARATHVLHKNYQIKRNERWLCHENYPKHKIMKRVCDVILSQQLMHELTC